MEFSRALIKNQLGDVAVGEAWKVERLDNLSFVIRPGEAWYDGLPYFLRSSTDALVSGTELALGIYPSGTTITDLQTTDVGYPGKKITLPGSVPSDTFRVVVEAREEVVTNLEDKFLKSANLSEATAQKLRLSYTINIVEESLQVESQTPYKSHDNTDRNLTNKITVNVAGAGSPGSVLAINSIVGSEQIDGRDLDVVVLNSSTGAQNPLPKSNTHQDDFAGGKLIDNVGNEYHIVFLQNDPSNTTDQDIIKLDKEYGQVDPVLNLSNSYQLIKRDVYTTDTVNGSPLGQRFFPVAKFVWKSTDGLTHDSAITDMRQVISKTGASQDTANTKFDLTLAGGGTTTVEPASKAFGSFTITSFADLSTDTFEVRTVDFIEGTDFTASGSDTITATALAQAINSSTDPLLVGIVTAEAVGTLVTITSVDSGTAANSYTISYTDQGTIGATVSGATLTGGTALIEGLLVWEDPYAIVNPHSLYKSTLPASTAVLQDGGTLACFLDYDLSADSDVANGQLSLTTTNFGVAGTAITLSGSPDLSGAKIGNTVLITSSNESAAIVAIDDVNKTITLDGDTTATGTSVVYLDTFAPGTLPVGYSTYVIATRETNTIYINNGIILASGESSADDGSGNTDAATIINQDRTAKLVRGGTWSWDLGTDTLSWSTEANVSIAGLTEAINSIPAGSSSGLDADGKVLYVNLNRSAPGGVLTVSAIDIALVPLDASILVIARRVGDDVLVGNSFLLKDKEQLEFDGALAELNRMLGQIRITQSSTDTVDVSGADITLLDGSILSQQSSELIIDYSGGTVDFTAGTGADGLNGILLDITSDNEYKWFSLSLVEDTTSADNRVTAILTATPAASSDANPALAPYPAITGDKKMGAVLVKRSGSSAVITTIRKFLLQSESAAVTGAQSGTLQEAYDLDVTNLPVRITTDSGQGDVDITGTQGLVVSADQGLNVSKGVTQTSSTTTEVISLTAEQTSGDDSTVVGTSALNTRLAQKFLANETGLIEEIRVQLNQPDNLTYKAELFAEIEGNTGTPQATGLLATSAVIPAGSVAFGQWQTITFSFPTPAEIKKGTNYFLVFEEVTSDVTPSILRTESTVLPTYPEGMLLEETGTLFSWNAYNTPLVFAVDVKNTFESTNIKLHGATSGSAEIQATKLTTDYRMLLPSTQGLSGQSMTNDGDGNLNWENNLPTKTRVDLQNNRTELTNIPDFAVDSTIDKGFSADVVLSRTNALAPTINTTWQTNHTANGFTVPAGSVIAMQPDGKVLVGLAAPDNVAPNKRLIRINVDGTDDTDFRNAIGTFTQSGDSISINSIIVEPTGNILVGGDFTYVALNSDVSTKLLRLSTSGDIDSSFNPTAVGNWAELAYTGGSGGLLIYDILLQPDNKIVLVGDITTTTASVEINGGPQNSPVAMTRITSQGLLDVDFEQSVWAVRYVSGSAPGAMDSDPIRHGKKGAVLPNGDIIITGEESFWDATQVLRKFDKFGRLQPGFNNTVGVAGPGINKIIGQSDNSIILAGSLVAFEGSPVGYVVKLNNDGTENTEYTTTVGTAFDNIVRDIARQPDGKLVVVGDFQDFNGDPADNLVRLNVDGTVDDTFPIHTSTGVSLTGVSIGYQGHTLINGTFTDVDSISATNLAMLVADTTTSKHLTLRGFFDDNTQRWHIGESTFIGSDVGVELTMSDSGQLQYTSTNLAGTQVTNFISFLLRKL